MACLWEVFLRFVVVSAYWQVAWGNW
jgi:hypothetical protein